ncbi:Alpha/Beta hydrolase protein [Kalaharituber pfeilii]|nr:Alpha/Beta hydrolase protein [Kalaharituber pfeilii]
MAIEPFKIHIPDDFLAYTNQKFETVRFIDDDSFVRPPGKEWDDGTPVDVLQELVQYWKDGKYNLRHHEHLLNTTMPQYTTPISVPDFGELKLHFAWIRSPREGAVPLLLCHGWPGSFWEFSRVVKGLAEPEDAGVQAFHCVVPSIPGYVFSERAKKPGFGVKQVAYAYDQLMKKLGYKHYVAHGGDWGHLFVRHVSLLCPSAARAVHTTMPVCSAPTLLSSPTQYISMILGFVTNGLLGLDKASCDSLLRMKEVREKEMGYLRIQGTKPATLAHGMTDSAVGLLGWLREKMESWTDKYPWTPDEIFTWWMLYWYPGPYGGFRLYKESADDHAFASGWSDVPMGISQFPKEIIVFPAEWMAKLHPVKYIRKHTSGGHFAAWERPHEIVGDLREFFKMIIDEDENLRAPKLNE